MQRIVVGVDGSPGAAAALRWALEEAGRHGAHLVAVRAWGSDDDGDGDGDGKSWSHGEVEEREALRSAVEAVDSPVPVEQRLRDGAPADALVLAARDADLLVVGARGTGGFAGLLLGSVGERVLERAPCPVARIGTEPGGGGPRAAVVVGVDGSEGSARALRWAAEEARVRGCPLRVVHAHDVPAVALPLAAEVATALEEAARRLVDDACGDPALVGLEAEAVLHRGGATTALLAHADEAALVVVGSRGRGRLAQVLLGSTSRQLAHHARCPLVVVPPPGRA